jgi:hypothetical protein
MSRTPAKNFISGNGLNFNTRAAFAALLQRPEANLHVHGNLPRRLKPTLYSLHLAAPFGWLRAGSKAILFQKPGFHHELPTANRIPKECLIDKIRATGGVSRRENRERKGRE